MRKRLKDLKLIGTKDPKAEDKPSSKAKGGSKSGKEKKTGNTGEHSVVILNDQNKEKSVSGILFEQRDTASWSYVREQ